jgi:hypothetical protein
MASGWPAFFRIRMRLFDLGDKMEQGQVEQRNHHNPDRLAPNLD